MRIHHLLGLVIALLATSAHAQPAARRLLTESVHRRSGDQREWSRFAPAAPGSAWELEFDAPSTAGEATLRVRQEDVRQVWKVSLNGREVGRLMQDENPMVVHFSVPRGLLQKTGNQLRIESDSKAADDVLLGPVDLLSEGREQLLQAASARVEVRDEEGRRLPCRLTFVTEDGSLIETGAASDQTLAVRPGTIYTLSGEALAPLPAGSYTVYAGRGFEYSLASKALTLEPGQTQLVSLQLTREVPTEGYVACDTHVHSRTHSGHGDATVEERMITLAGEGIELPIATDHNVGVDHRPFARKIGADRWFTPVVGDEVTTRKGHFNVFPIAFGAAAPDHRGEDWKSIFAAIDGTPGVKAVILNHPRDLHGGYRPFGASELNSAAGESLDGWQLRANAMEVLNSSATQSDIMRLFHDWMTMLNSGRRLTPVGSSDSHDVARHFVGQGRTYIRCDDQDPGAIDVAEAVASFAAGRVRVSYGLLVELQVAGRWTSGEVARVSDGQAVDAQIRVLGPSWVAADEVSLYANGELVRRESIDGGRRRSKGVIYEETWQVERPLHDVHWTAIATGPGIDRVYWRTAQPYQSDSPEWTPRLIGCSGAVWLDADGDGRAWSPREQALQAVAAAGGAPGAVVEKLANFDAPTAVQAAFVLHQAGMAPLGDAMSSAFSRGAPSVREGYRRYVQAWRESQAARAGR